MSIKIMVIIIWIINIIIFGWMVFNGVIYSKIQSSLNYANKKINTNINNNKNWNPLWANKNYINFPSI